MFKPITICTIIWATALADVSHIVKPDTRLLSPFGDTPLYSENRGPSIKQDKSGSFGGIEIVRQDQIIEPDGSYNWAYETSNGIVAQEEGKIHVDGQEEPSIKVQGSFAYTSPDGQPIGVNYIADENGFQPQGDHLPTPPPIPEAIQRALEWLAAHPEPDENPNKSIV